MKMTLPAESGSRGLEVSSASRNFKLKFLQPWAIKLSSADLNLNVLKDT
jgi:hypothetical protein